MSAPTLNTLLIANRGEIACRIMRTAKNPWLDHRRGTQRH